MVCIAAGKARKSSRAVRFREKLARVFKGSDYPSSSDRLQPWEGEGILTTGGEGHVAAGGKRQRAAGLQTAAVGE